MVAIKQGRGGSRVFIWGGEGCRCLRTHITSAKRDVPYSYTGPGSSIALIFFFFILIQTGMQ